MQKRPIVARLRLVILALVFAFTSVFGNLILFVTATYAATPITDVSYDKVGSIANCGLIQGGTSDGQYVYSACVNNSSHSNTVIVKSDLAGKKLSSSTGYSRKEVGHANAMTYNSKLGKLVLTMWDDDTPGTNHVSNKLRLIDPSSLKSDSVKTLSHDVNATNVCYSPSTDQYIVNGQLFDSNYKYVRTIFSGGDNQFNSDSQMSGDTAGQGIGCDNSHIYVIRWSKSKSITRIISYDWSGNASAVYNIKNLPDELESVFIMNGEMYGGVNTFSGNSSNLIKINNISLDTSSTVPIAIGAYNVLGCNHTSGDVSGRMSTLAKNIDELAYDVVGMSEYNVAECSGKLIEKLSAYGNWKDTKHYTNDNTEQTGIIYNADKVTLKSEEVLNTVSGCQTMNDYARTDGPGQRGGSCYVRIAHFTSSSGTEFIVANGHYAMDHSKGGGDMREKQIKSVIDKLSGETMPVFIVGDTNAAPPYATSSDAVSWYKSYDHNFYDNLNKAGYQMASQTATEKKNGNWATIGGSESSGYQIDQIFYKNMAAPAYFEVFGCNDVSDCGSDHRPVKAIFGTAKGGCGNLTDAQKAQFEAWNILYYDPSCVCSEGTGTGVMAGDTNGKKIATYLASKGLNAIAIAGILGNWDVESPRQSVFRQEGNQPWPTGGYGIVQWTGGRRTNASNTGVVDALRKDTRTKDSFTQYYDSKYGGAPPENGIPTGVPTEVNDAWLQVELDFTLQEFTQAQYKIGGGYTKLLKTAVPYVNDGEDLKTALNGAKTPTDAALMMTTIFEKQGALAAIKDGTKEQLLNVVSGRVSQAEKDLAAVQALVGSGGGTAASGATCAGSASTNGAVIIDGMTFPLQGADKKFIGDGGGGKGSHLEGGTCPNYWAYDLMMNGSPEAQNAAKTVKVVAITGGTISKKVTIKSYSLGGQPYGWQLGLEASDGSLFYYTHMLNQPTVKVGQAVKTGDLLETGVKDVNGEHLHIDESPKGKGRDGAFSGGLSRSTCSGVQQGDFVELGPALKKLWEALP